MFYLVGFLLLLFLLSIVVFIIKNILLLPIFNKINNKLLKTITSILVIVLVFIVFGIVNGTIILFHLFIFVSLFMLIIYILKKVTKREYKNYYPFVCGVFLTFIYFIYAFYCGYNIKETTYQINTDKYIGMPFRIVMFSDSHVGVTFDGKGLLKTVNRINKLNPDIVVIVGDFIDDSTTKEDMINACASLKELKTKSGVYFVYGNHDRSYYNNSYTSTDLENELFLNNVNVLIDDVREINDYIYLIGRQDKRFNRKNIQDLVLDIDKDKYIIDLNHQPNDYENEKDNVDLVLSGHTHGGQLFPFGYVGKLLKINNEFYGLTKKSNTSYIITSGLSSWEIPFKSGVHSEYVVIDIGGKNYE